MPPNPEFHNGKLPEDGSFVNSAFSGGNAEIPIPATPSPASTADNSPRSTSPIDVPANVLTNRRNSSGISKSQQQQHETINEKLSTQHNKGHKGAAKAASDANNNNNNGGNDKAMVCGSAREEDQLMDFDDLLPYIGEFGRYQKILFLLMIPFAFFVAWTYFSQIFLTLVPEEFHCALPELDALVASPAERRSLGIPIDQTKSTADQIVYDRCSMFAVNFTEILARYNGNVSHVLEAERPNDNWPRQMCTNGYWFNFTDIPYETAATEFGWVCENDTYGTWATSIFFVGAIVGGLLFGWVADRYGRVPALVFCNLTGFVGGIATAFSMNFWQFCLCRFLVGFAFDNCFTMMYILVLEYVGPKWRTFVANMSIAIFFTFAACLLPWMALFLANWKWFAVAVSAPLVLAVFTPLCIPESARWLVSQGQTKRAMTILRKFARLNRAQVDETIFRKFESDCEELRRREDELLTETAPGPDGTKKRKNYSVLDLFRSPHLCKVTVLLIFIWMAISLVFDGHVRNVDNLGMDIFITFTIATATEFPADSILTLILDRWGRRWLAFGSMAASGLFSLAATTVPVGVASASLAILGRFCVNISYNIGLQYAAELLPTVVRAQGVAFIHIMGYIAQMISPFVVYLAQIQQKLPLVILGLMGVVGGCLALLLPETLDKVLPQTLQDGEEFGKDQKFFEFPCIGKKAAEIERQLEEEEERKRVAQLKKELDVESPSPFKRFNSDLSRGSARVSLRAFNRGEFQSSLLRRSSRPQTPQLPH